MNQSAKNPSLPKNQRTTSLYDQNNPPTNPVSGIPDNNFLSTSSGNYNDADNTVLPDTNSSKPPSPTTDLSAAGSISDTLSRPPTLNNEEFSSTPIQTPATQATINSVKPEVKTDNSSSDQVENPVSQKKQKLINFLLFILGPLFMIGAFCFLIITLDQQTPSQPQPELQTSETTIEEVTTDKNQEKMSLTLINSPKNPNQATAVCRSTGEQLTSGNPTGCPDPLFSWSGEQAQEPNTKVVGYYVYFGSNSNDEPISPNSPINLFQKVIRPIHDGNYQTENSFAPENLKKNQTYYLAVSAVSDSQNSNWKFGLDIVDPEKLTARSAKILFVYDYQLL